MTGSILDFSLNSPISFAPRRVGMNMIHMECAAFSHTNSLCFLKNDLLRNLDWHCSMLMNCIALREYNLYRKISPKSSSTLCSQRHQKQDTPATLNICQIMSAFKAVTNEANQPPPNQKSKQWPTMHRKTWSSPDVPYQGTEYINMRNFL